MRKQKTKFKQTEIGKAISINPKRELIKGTISKKVAMEKLDLFNKKIKGFENADYNGGSKFINGDTLLARITPCLENGKTAYVDFLHNKEVGFGSTEFIVLSGKEGSTINEFVYYLAISPKFRDHAISSMTGTSGRQRVQADFLETKNIEIPPLPEQKAIASILSSLDEKIELNNKMNKTLESIGQAIFKKWFVDEKKEGWEKGKLGDIGKIICGKTPPKTNSNFFNGRIPFIKIPDMHTNIFILKTTETLSEEGKNSQLNKTIPRGAICVSCIATVGLVSITSEESQTNQQINSIVPKKDFMREYLYYYLVSLRRKLKDMGSGGAVTLNVNTTSFSKVEILMPSKDILKKFNQVTCPLFNKILSNVKQNQALSKIRDTLLPKLMNGEVRVR